MKKTVYFAFSEDLLHEGHKKILKYASKFGDVTVGLLTDSAIIEYKNLPHLSYKQREELIKKIPFIKRVLPQETLDYSKNIN